MAVDLDGIRFVVAPGKYPPRLPYVLVRDDAHVLETLPLLQAFAPQAPFLGYVSAAARPDEVGPSATAVISSPDWPALVAGIRRHLPPERIAVLLNPLDYPWGYLEVARAAPDRIWELVDPKIPVSLKVSWLRQYLARHARTTFEGEQPQWFPECYFLPFRDLLRENAAAIHEVMVNLADQESRDAYTLVLYGSPEDLLQRFLSRVFHEQQYVEMTRLRPGDAVVNAGVAEGWDIPYLLACTRARGRHVLVDPVESPDGTEAAKLRDAFDLEFAAGGLWDRSETLQFPVDEVGMVVGTRPGEEIPGRPMADVRCLPLDELVRETGLDRLDLVKIDIEGAEPRALEGMRETLQTYRPQLAVCIYHQPDHMWTIPATLMAWLTDYRYFVRHYSPVRFECVFYAIPAERLPAAGSGDPFLDAAGIDGRLLRRTWELAGARPAFDDAVAEYAGEPPAAGELGAAAEAIDARLGEVLAATAAGPPVGEIEMPAAGKGFVGSGWGPAGWDREYAWRWFGPSGAGSVFLPLDRKADYLCRLYLFNADSQDAFDTATLDVNGVPAADREFGKGGDYHYIQWRIPAAPDDATRGRSRLLFRTVPGPRRVSVVRVNCWRAG